MKALLTMFFVQALLFVANSEQLPIGSIPLEVGSSGDWTVVCGGRGGRYSLEVELKDRTGSVVTIDTIGPPEPGTVFDGWVLPNMWRQGEFFVATENLAAPTHTIWLLNAESKEFRRIHAWDRGVSAVVVGCRGARLLISGTGPGGWAGESSVPSVAALVDVDSGRIVREWEGLYVHPWGFHPNQYPRYDETTESIWIFPPWFHPGHPLARETAQHMIGVDCADGDTTVIREDVLFGEDIGHYVLRSMYQGRIVVETEQGATDRTKDLGYRRVVLVDLVSRRVQGEWLLDALEPYADQIEGVEITGDLQGVVYLETDKTGRWRILAMRAGERKPKRTLWTGDERPRFSRSERGALLMNGMTLEELGLVRTR